MSPNGWARGRTAGSRTALVLGVLCIGAGPRAHGQQVAASYDSVYNALRRIAPRADRVAVVRDLVVQRDAAQFRLAAGKLYLLSDVAGRTVGAAFTGTGVIAFTPPTAVERAQLRRVLGDSSLDASINTVVFLFADSTLAELERRVRFLDGTTDGLAVAGVSSALDFLIENRERRADPTLMSALLNGRPNGWFAAYVKRDRGEDVMVRLDPFEAEEVQLLRRGRLQNQRVEMVCQFQRAEDIRDSVIAGNALPDPVRIEEYRIDSRIGHNFEYAARASARLAARRDAGPWLVFDLFSELDVDSVLGEDGAPLPHFRADKSQELWVREASPLAAGSARTIRFVYHGKLIEVGGILDLSGTSARVPRGLDNWAFIRSTWNWYPRYGSAEPARMDLTFRTPRELPFASIGRLADSHTEGDTLVTHWVTERPTDNASFNIGEMVSFEVTDPRIPPVTVFYNREAHAAIRQLAPSAFPAEEQVGRDVVNSLAFFTEKFGPPLFQHYYATEIPYAHGQAFPGLIHLSIGTFLGVSTRGEGESFRAHEIAHQWWGIGVEPATYRDWWLSEGFAEFSGLWYMQMALLNNDNYFRRLRLAREAIRRERERMAPTGLGPRAAQSATGQYELAVYQKGAWILHMLRNMMLDMRTMSDDRFTAMMRDFYTTYRGRKATTEDFQRVVERHMNAPMGWFFREWVNGTAVPAYVLSWRADPTAEGRYLVRIRIRQEDVPADFEMDVPLRVELPDSVEAFVRIQVKGPLTETQFTLPGEPRRLELNPLESVLAETRSERWR
jgi:hypothetical protein